MVGSAWMDGRESTRQLMFTICKSCGDARQPNRTERKAGEFWRNFGLLESKDKERRAFCAGEGCNHTGLRANVEDDGCLEPWNLHEPNTEHSTQAGGGANEKA